eukprot:SAG31_NODE_7711_length_1611_cov_1.617063_2_plen_183_part_01
MASRFAHSSVDHLPMPDTHTHIAHTHANMGESNAPRPPAKPKDRPGLRRALADSGSSGLGITTISTIDAVEENELREAMASIIKGNPRANLPGETAAPTAPLAPGGGADTTAHVSTRNPRADQQPHATNADDKRRHAMDFSTLAPEDDDVGGMFSHQLYATLSDVRCAASSGHSNAQTTPFMA